MAYGMSKGCSACWRGREVVKSFEYEEGQILMERVERAILVWHLQPEGIGVHNSSFLCRNLAIWEGRNVLSSSVYAVLPAHLHRHGHCIRKQCTHYSLRYLPQ